MNHVSRGTAALAAAAISSFGVVALAPSAPAAAAGCATRPEYRQVHSGMTAHRVHTILGSHGAVSGAGGLVRTYRVCNVYAQKHSVVVKYMDMSGQPAMVYSKSWTTR
jgi:hypothetical protein